MMLSAVKEMELLAAVTPGAISLAQGTPAFDTPDVIKLAAIEAIMNGTAAPYAPPQGLPVLRQKIAKHLQKQNMLYNWEDEIIVTAGASEAIVSSLRSLITSHRNEVVILSPSYAGYTSMIHAAGGSVVHAQLTTPDWRLDSTQLSGLVGSKTAAVLLAHPNNPTGSLLNRHELQQIVELANVHDFMVISDEVYSDMVYNPAEFISPSLIDRSRVIRIHSLSKTFGMTGWRIAFAHGPAEVIKRILPMHDAIVTCAPVVSQFAALAALDNYEELTRNMRKWLRLQKRLAARELGLTESSPLLPQAGYFLFLPLPAGSARTLLRQNKIATVPGEAFGPGYEGFIRICFGRDERSVRTGIRRIKRFMQLESLVEQRRETYEGIASRRG